MKVVYCTSGGLYGALVLAGLLESDEVEVTGVVLSTRVLHKDYAWLQGARQQAMRSGARYALYLWAVTGLADVLDRRSSVAALAARHRIPMRRTRDINESQGLAFVTQCAPDVLLSGFFNQRLSGDVCAIPPLGAVNIHPGKLPGFKGVDPVFFALLSHEDKLGVSLHRVTHEFDAGPLLCQSEIDAGRDSVLASTAKLFCLGTLLFIEAIPRLRDRDVGNPQAATGRYDSWPSPQDVDRLVREGHALWCWSDRHLLMRRPNCAHFSGAMNVHSSSDRSKS